MSRDPLLPNALIVARREYTVRLSSRLFHLSTVLLAVLAVVVALSPLLFRIADRGTVTRVAVVAGEPELSDRTVSVLDGLLNSNASAGRDVPPFLVEPSPTEQQARADLAAGRIQAAVVASRAPTGQLSFEILAGDGIADDKLQLVSVGAFGVAVLDFAAENPVSGFRMPTLELSRQAAGSGGGEAVAAAQYAGQRIVGIVLVVFNFLTLVIYGMWVAAGVAAEKESRVMELVISAASARQLVVGKVLGIGLAGLTQAACVLVPAGIALLVQERLGEALLGPGPAAAPSLSALTPALVGGYLAFFVLGFALYALIYAAAGSLVSRVEDVQMLALPLSIVAIAGYLIAVAALTGGTSWIVRLASYVPFWSPFVMLTRLTSGRVAAWEVGLALGLLGLAIVLALVVAVRVYAAGVLLYGQRPGLRTLIAALRSA